MRRQIKIWIACAVFVLPAGMLGLSTGARAEDPSSRPSLEDELQGLATPANTSPLSMTSEKLYSVQSRYSGLRLRSEFDFGGAWNFTSDSFVESRQLNAAYRFHLNGRWSVGVSGSWVVNDYSSAGQRLLRMTSMVPDTAYVKYRADLSLGFNAFYGKFRLTADRVFYFDQYWTLGPASIWMDTGQVYGASADAGFVFWLGRWGSLRLGLKDYFYRQQRVLSAGLVHDLTGHVDLGILLGAGT
jgi:outer membrane beta-barrel protein